MEIILTDKVCVACEGGIPPMTESEIIKLRPQLDQDWQVIENKKIKREFRFEDYKKTFEFVSKVAELAEQEGHHPTIEFTWGKATITLWTHAINGLSENDFILAAKIDQIV
jgi:4a-hydroxytetrahydrobiopterin dehydratase